MARTKAEVRKWLDSQVGKSVNAKSAPYQGQCVSLIKGLLEYVGAPQPYKARGNATDVAKFYLADKIAKKGDGWLRVVINHDMGYIGGVRYGHVWIDLKGEVNYEQNGVRALYTTKNTRPYSQRQTVINLDQWLKAEAKPAPKKKSVATLAKEVLAGKWGNGLDRKKKLEKAGYNYNAVQAEVNRIVSKPVSPKIKKGDKVTVTNKVDYYGKRLFVAGKYDVIELKGDRAVIGKGKAVTAAIKVSNLKKA